MPAKPSQSEYATSLYAGPPGSAPFYAQFRGRDHQSCLLPSYKSPDTLAFQNRPNTPRFLEIKHDNGQLIFHTERNRRGIHHLQPALEGFEIGQLGQLDGVWMRHRIRIVDAIDLRGFQHHICTDLRGPQSCRRIRGKIRIPRTSSKNHDTAFFQMADG